MADKKANHKPMIFLSLIVIGFTIAYSMKQNALIFKYSEQIAIEGEPAASDFALPLLSGNLIRLSDFKGSVVPVNVWATWCPPCVYEMPSMQKLHQQYANEQSIPLLRSTANERL